MGVSLEAGKIVAAGWLHANWHNKAVNWLHKTYMTTAVVVLMVITALGIYGFLSKGHLEQQASGAPVVLQITQKETRIDQLKGQITILNARQDQLDTAVNAIIADNAQGGLRVRRQQAAERAEIRKELDQANQEINTITTELVPLKTDVAEVDAKLGPVKYLAEAFGWENPEAAVRLVILLLMFAFDPLAVVMVISALITINEVSLARRAKKQEKLDELHKNIDPVGEHIQTTRGDLGVVEFEDFVFSDNKDSSTHIVELEPTDDNVSEGFDDDIEVWDEVVEHHKAMQEHIDVRDNTQVYIPNIVENDLVIEENDTSLMAELERELSPREKDAKQLVEILERRPDLLQNVIEAVKEETGNSNVVTIPSEDKSDSWMDGINIPQR